MAKPYCKHLRDIGDCEECERTQQERLHLNNLQIEHQRGQIQNLRYRLALAMDLAKEHATDDEWLKLTSSILTKEDNDG